MTRRVLALVLITALAPPASVRSQVEGDPQVEAGIRQVREADFEGAILTLDGVIRRMSSEKGDPRQLARVHTYISIAYLNLGQEQTARTHFSEALKLDPRLEISLAEFPPRVVKFFDEVKAAAAASPSPAPVPTPVASRPAPRATPAPAKKGGSRKGLLLVGVGVLAAGGVGVAVAGGGGSDGVGPGGGGDVPSGNRPPTVTVTASDREPLMGATQVSFSASGSDPDGDALTYTWSFGDDGSGSGPTVSHAYMTAGTFNVVLTVTDSRGANATSNTTVIARSLEGNWFSEARAWRFEIRHTGSQITGRLTGFRTVVFPNPQPLAGVVRNPRSVEFDVPGTLGFVGTADGAVARLTGTLNEGSRDYGEILVRQ